MKWTSSVRRDLWIVGMASLLCAPISAQVTQRVSVMTGGGQANGGSVQYTLTISADGRFVAFLSNSTNLVPGDTNGYWDVFVRDRIAGTTERASVATGGAEANGASDNPSISADGRYVAFESLATNLVSGDTNAVDDIFVHDRVANTTERVSVATSGAQSNRFSERPSISADGRYVAFHSEGTGLVPGDTNGTDDIFVRDRIAGTTERVSVDSGGVQGNGGSRFAAITPDGRYVAFQSYATNLVPGDTNGQRDIFVHDRQTGTTVRVNVDSSGLQADADSDSPSISADGRYVAFESLADNLVAGDSDVASDVFVHDVLTGITERVSVSSGGVQGNDRSYLPSISADGRLVAFRSYATNLVAGDTNHFVDILVRDRLAGTTERASVATDGAQANGDSGYNGLAIAGEGRFVAFASHAGDLDPGDTNSYTDVFVHDRDSTSFTSSCDPGVDGVIACPCSNAPAGAGRGCDNSAATGGAILSASGIAYLSMDSLVLTTSAEKPTATSIVLQGPSSPPAGIVYGQGVRCVGGSLKRLFVKTAVGGSITAPDFGAGDPTVSTRSAAKGDVIQPGQSRWYLVYYRDPVVLGGCPASSTFNATQTGRVDWSL